MNTDTVYPDVRWLDLLGPGVRAVALVLLAVIALGFVTRRSAALLVVGVVAALAAMRPRSQQPWG